MRTEVDPQLGRDAFHPGGEPSGRPVRSESRTAVNFDLPGDSIRCRPPGPLRRGTRHGQGHEETCGAHPQQRAEHAVIHEWFLATGVGLPTASRSRKVRSHEPVPQGQFLSSSVLVDRICR